LILKEVSCLGRLVCRPCRTVHRICIQPAHLTQR
jgi:hypothetical protein